MSIMMDYVASAIVFGILLITIASIQVNINSTLYESTFSVRVQGNSVDLAYQLEHDLLKAGYHVTLGTALTVADTTRVSFQGDLYNTGTINTVSYTVGTTANLPNTINPRDFPLYRTVDGTQLRQNWGLISLKFADYDSAMIDKLTATPLSASDRARVRAIVASFTVQSPEPVISNVDTTWPAVSWQKVMWPRNLGTIQ